jgi:50S ribosome-binding GTPase
MTQDTFFLGIDSPSEAVAAYQGARDVALDLLALWRKLRAALTSSKRNLLLWGPSGTGKSALHALLTGDQSDSSDSLGYDHTDIPEEGVHRRNKSVVVVDFPGHIAAQKQYAAQLSQKLASTKNPCVVLVVAAGYHAVRGHTFDEIGTSLEEYVISKQRAEVESLQRLYNAVEYGPSKDIEKLTLVTFVNKQDLWWSEKEMVRRLYADQASLYCAQIAELSNLLGSDRFQHHLTSGCLLRLNFFQRLTCAGYDDDIKGRVLREFIHLLDAALAAD